MRNAAELPLPPHFDPAAAGDWAYAPDQLALMDAAQEWRGTYGLRPAGEAAFDLHLLLVDLQKDFCHPRGALPVLGRRGRGAVEDNERIASFIYRNLGRITNITATLDTHFAYQIFFPSFWIDPKGKLLRPHMVVTAEMIRQGTARPNPDLASWLCDGDQQWLQQQVLFYCEELAREGKYELYLWPPHCLLGSDGHPLMGVIHEARLFHAFCRGVQSHAEIKGGNPLTENYSALRPEVLRRFDGGVLAERNADFLRILLGADAVVIAGQAASHCVKSTIEDLLGEIMAVDAKLARKVYILEDCMSAVTVPDGQGGFVADFTPQAEEALARFHDAGMHVVRSSEPLDSWPDLAARIGA